MKKFILLSLTILCAIFTLNQVNAGYVNGYFRSDGTYVKGYYRSTPNNTVIDNYSYYGNTNPYTGKIGNNYYRKNPSSFYYTPSYNFTYPKYKTSKRSYYWNY